LSEVACAWGDGGGLWSFSFTEIILGIPVDFGAVFLHENKSRKPPKKPPKNMPRVIVVVIVARNRCLWVPIIWVPSYSVYKNYLVYM
jgi:hypothetical protein